MTLTFGKYNGWELEQIPDEYVHYMIDAKRKDLALWEDEWARRELVREAKLSWMEKLAKAGYHAMSLKHHPDRGGAETDMQAINAAMAQLQEILASVQDTKGNGR